MRKISLVLLVVFMLSLCAFAQADEFVSSIDWNAEYDVVVIGYGGSGSNAAISAADAGAKVLLTEKAPKGSEGGNMRVSGQIALSIVDREKAIEYFKGLRGDFDSQTDENIEAYVDGLMGNEDWLISLGANPDEMGHSVYTEYPEIPNGEAMQFVSLHGKMWQGDMWPLFAENVKKRSDKIDVWYNSPAVGLIQDPTTKVIHGVKVEHEGQTYNVRAINGVVMAMGGFENSDEILENYAQLGDCYPKGTPYNTGDGVKMAIEVGANLWHMSNLAGPDVNFINPDTGIAAGYMFTRETSAPQYNAFTTGSVIIVGGDGTRFMQETFTTRHGHVNVGGQYFSLQIPKNSWCVFDEKARLNMPAYPSWSEGMVDEIEKGWIVKANSLEELAELMNIDADSLKAQVDRYNQYCADGYDPEYKVPAKFLIPIDAEGPYYAFPVKATLTNTMGGAKRDAECRVLDTHDQPIPHLYSCGEFGSFFIDLYNGAGNVGEAIYTGKIAGANAAAEKADAIHDSKMGANTPVDFRIADETFEASENEFLGTATGMGGDLVVKVKMSGDQIESVEILSNHETVGVADRALAEIPQKIVETQSTEVDTVAGATITSNAIMNAVRNALNQN